MKMSKICTIMVLMGMTSAAIDDHAHGGADSIKSPAFNVTLFDDTPEKN